MKHSKETRRKIGEANKIALKKRWRDKKYRERMRKAHLGYVPPAKQRKRQSESIAKIYKMFKKNRPPMNAYRALHVWVAKKLGKPTTCADCKRKNLKGRKIHWANKSGNYRRTTTDWIRLCSKCHRRRDFPFHDERIKKILKNREWEKTTHK